MNEKSNLAPSSTDARALYIICKAPTGVLCEIGNKGQAGYRMQLIAGANQGTFRKGDGMFLSSTVNDYGITVVSSEFWNAWKKTAQGKNLLGEYEGRKIIVVCESKDEAEAARLDGGDVKTGFEAINPDKLPIKGLERSPVGPDVE
jgi:hypothetical protein